MGAGETVMDYRHIWAVISRSHIPPAFSRRQKSCIMVSQRRPGTRAALSVCMNASCHYCIYQLEQTKRETTVLSHQTNYQPEKKGFSDICNFQGETLTFKSERFFFDICLSVWNVFCAVEKWNICWRRCTCFQMCSLFVLWFNWEVSENVQTVKKKKSSINGVRQFSTIKLLLNK